MDTDSFVFSLKPIERLIENSKHFTDDLALAI